MQSFSHFFGTDAVAQVELYILGNYVGTFRLKRSHAHRKARWTATPVQSGKCSSPQTTGAPMMLFSRWLSPTWVKQSRRECTRSGFFPLRESHGSGLISSLTPHAPSSSERGFGSFRARVILTAPNQHPKYLTCLLSFISRMRHLYTLTVWGVSHACGSAAAF